MLLLYTRIYTFPYFISLYYISFFVLVSKGFLMELSTCDSRFGRVQNRLHRFDCLYDALTGTMTYALVYFDSNGREHRHRFPSVFHGLCDQLDGDVRMYFACKGAYLSLFSRMNATLCSLCQSVGLWLLSLMLCIYLVFF